MKKTTLLLAIITLLSAGLISCRDENNSTGTISGFAYLCDTVGNKLANSSGITVTLDNTMYTTQTDSMGHFEFTGIKAGVYSISFAKKGHSGNKLVNKQFIGEDEYYVGEAHLRKLPAINSITNVSVYNNPLVDSVRFTASIASTLSPKRCRMYVGKNSSVSSASGKYIYSESVFYSKITTPDPIPFYVSLKKAFFLNIGYKPGETAYIILYPDCGTSTLYLEGFYWDNSTDDFIYTSLGSPSNVFPVTVPY